MNGKVRDSIEVAADEAERAVEARARAPERAAPPRRTSEVARIVVPGQLVNFVVASGRAAGTAGDPSSRIRAVRLRRLSEAAVEERGRLRSYFLMDAGDLGSRNLTVTWVDVPAGRSSARTRTPTPSRCT